MKASSTLSFAAQLRVLIGASLIWLVLALLFSGLYPVHRPMERLPLAVQILGLVPATIYVLVGPFALGYLAVRLAFGEARRLRQHLAAVALAAVLLLCVCGCYSLLLLLKAPDL